MQPDLIILENKLFEIDPHDVSTTTLLMTLISGAVRRRDDLWKV